MTRINDVATLIDNRLALCDEMCVEPNPDIMAKDLLDAGHLLPDLPKPDVITPRTEITPDPIGLWNTDHPSVTGSPSIPPVVFVDEYTDLPPDEARAYAYAILAAANYAEEHTNDQ